MVDAWVLFTAGLICAVAAVCFAAAWARELSHSAVLLTEPTERGELLTFNPGMRSERVYVAGRTIPNQSEMFVVAVRPYRWFDRWAWARRWL